jgi:hypothetical protein
MILVRLEIEVSPSGEFDSQVWISSRTWIDAVRTLGVNRETAAVETKGDCRWAM